MRFCSFTTKLSRSPGLEHEETGTSGHRRGDRSLRHEQYETIATVEGHATGPCPSFELPIEVYSFVDGVASGIVYAFTNCKLSSTLCTRTAPLLCVQADAMGEGEGDVRGPRERPKNLLTLYFTRTTSQSFPNESQIPREPEWDRSPTGHWCLSNKLHTLVVR